MKKFLFMLVMAVLLVTSLAGCGTSENPAYTMEYTEGKVITGESMNVDFNMVGVFFDFTNQSGKSALPADLADVKAYQHGTELTVMVFTGSKTEGAVQCDTSLQDGTTQKVVWLYQLEDDSEVSVECSDGQKFTIELQ